MTLTVAEINILIIALLAMYAIAIHISLIRFKTDVIKYFESTDESIRQSFTSYLRLTSMFTDHIKEHIDKEIK